MNGIRRVRDFVAARRFGKCDAGEAESGSDSQSEISASESVGHGRGILMVVWRPSSVARNKRASVIVKYRVVVPMSNLPVKYLTDM